MTTSSLRCCWFGGSSCIGAGVDSGVPVRLRLPWLEEVALASDAFCSMSSSLSSGDWMACPLRKLVKAWDLVEVPNVKAVSIVELLSEIAVWMTERLSAIDLRAPGVSCKPCQCMHLLNINFQMNSSLSPVTWFWPLLGKKISLSPLYWRVFA